MQRNVNFGRNLIWPMAENRIKKKEKYKFGQNKIWRMANTVQKDCIYALRLYDRRYRFTIYQFYVWNVINLYIYIFIFFRSEIRFFSFSAILYSLWYAF